MAGHCELCLEQVDHFSTTLCKWHLIRQAVNEGRQCTKIQRGGQGGKAHGKQCPRNAMPGYDWCRAHLLPKTPKGPDLTDLDDPYNNYP